MIRSTKVLVATVFLGLSLMTFHKNAFGAIDEEQIDFNWRVTSGLIGASYALTLLNSYLAKSRGEMYPTNVFEGIVELGSLLTAVFAPIPCANLAFENYQEGVEKKLPWYKSRYMAGAACAIAAVPLLYKMGAYDTLYGLYHNITPAPKNKTTYHTWSPGMGMTIISLS